MNTPMTATHVFYQASSNRVIDTCTDENPPRSHIQRETLEEINKRYPGTVYMPFDDARTLMDDKNRLPVTEITEEQFWYALEELPPMGWKQETNCESFKCMEIYSGTITNIYARVGDRYFSLRDSMYMKHAEIIGKCKDFIKGL